MMSGISNDVSVVLWISCGVNAINFFASFIGMLAHVGVIPIMSLYPRHVSGRQGGEETTHPYLLCWYMHLYCHHRHGVPAV